MFLLILLAVLLAATIHVARMSRRGGGRAAEVVLLYLLVGYCGLPMLVLSVVGLASPEYAVELFGIPGRNVQGAVALTFLAMSLIAVMALRYRGTYLIAPAVAWAVALGGGTFFHLHDPGARTHGGALALFATHGLIGILLVAALLWSGLLKEPGRRSSAGAPPTPGRS